MTGDLLVKPTRWGLTQTKNASGYEAFQHADIPFSELARKSTFNNV